MCYIIGVVIEIGFVYHSMNWLTNQVKVVATLLMNFGAHLNVLFIIKVRDFVLIK